MTYNLKQIAVLLLPYSILFKYEDFITLCTLLTHTPHLIILLHSILLV